MTNKYILIILIFLVSVLSIGDLYRTEVDTDYGFYQVRKINDISEKIIYEDRTLEIKQGDTLEWRNMADPDEIITLDGFEIIDENSFLGIFYSTLQRNYQTYSYTFNKTGKYRIHIDEYPQKIKSQTIIVHNIEMTPIITETPNVIEIPVQTPIILDTPKYVVTKESSGFGIELMIVISIMFLVIRRK